MGCSFGKPIDELPSINAQGVDILTHNSEENHDKRVIEYLKKQIDNHPEWFILNNLLMSIVIFRNYEKDLYDFSNTAVPREEQDIDAKLKAEVKKCILPGVLLNKIQENVKFLCEHATKNNAKTNEPNIAPIEEKRIYGEKKEQITKSREEKENNIETKVYNSKPLEEPLSQKTIYVVNNNIEVSVVDNDDDYTPIAVPGCRVIIEEINESLGGKLLIQETNDPEETKEKLNKKGFLRLKVISNSSANMKKDQLIKRKENVPPQTNDDNETKTSDEELIQVEDEYSEIIAFNTPKSINIKPTSERRETLPEDCFKKRQIKKVNQDDEPTAHDEDGSEEEESEDFMETNDERSESDAEMESGDEDMDDDEEEIRKLEEQKKNPELFEEVTYLSSSGFMEYFQNEVFPNTVGELLGFTAEEIQTAQALPGYITCEKKSEGQYKIIPAVPIDWPLQAEEFSHRESRKVLHDEKNWAIYKWPTDDMVEELKTLNCVVIPKGFVNKKGVKNPDSDIEWEIHFPKTERFLEIRLTHPQVRCYIFLIALFKTFIEKATTHRGLVIEHIRTHLFWECEEDAKSWPEHKMGNKILQVIEDLNTGLSRRKIPDYFIKDKNIFENIPSMYIQFAQKIFHDVLQFPVMHFLEALKNLIFVQEDFYPVPNLDELKYLLTAQNIAVPKITRKSSIRFKKNNQINKRTKKKRGTRVTKQRKMTPADEDLEWKKRNEKNNRRKHIKILNKKAEEDAKAAKTMDENKNFKTSFTKLEILRQVGILKFFINHFIEIVKKSKEIGPTNQSLFYLKQAWYNLKVLEDIEGVSDDTTDLEKIIRSEQDGLVRQSMQKKLSFRRDIAPPTPRRNKEPSQFNFIVENSEKKPSKSVKINLSPINVASTSKIKDKRPVREKKGKSVAFTDTVDDFDA